MSDEKDKAVEFFMESMEQFGVAIAHVTDGYMLAFKRAEMQKIIDSHPDQEKLIIFVKNPTLGI